MSGSSSSLVAALVTSFITWLLSAFMRPGTVQRDNANSLIALDQDGFVRHALPL
ncbi:hypothetical protein ABLN97_09145 [Mycobacterium tuberculosis]